MAKYIRIDVPVELSKDKKVAEALGALLKAIKEAKGDDFDDFLKKALNFKK